MPDFVWFLILAAIVIVLILLLRWYINWKAYGKDEHEKEISEKKKNDAAAKGLLVQCPLCNSYLEKGEDLISRVYRPMNVPDQLCTINGCPHCYPSVERGKKRICPVCRREVPLKDGHLTARLFNKAGNKKHVIVTGCSECCKH